jgi:hypothetical protein
MNPLKQIWHIANPPNDPFTWFVPSIIIAKRYLKALADFDLEIGDGQDQPVLNREGVVRARERIVRKYGNKPDTVILLTAYQHYLIKQNKGVCLVTSNAQGLGVRKTLGADWTEWYDSETGEDICSLLRGP